MKRILFLIVFLLTIKTTAQKWLSNLPQDKTADTYTFYDYQKAFNEYWEPFNLDGGYYINSKGEKQKAAGWKLFKRWEYYWESRVNQTTGKFPEKTSIDEYKKWQNENPQTNANQRNITSLTGDWQPLGPSSSGGGYAGTGRLNCIAFHPSDNNTYWVGSPSGGLWKTSDDGASWTVLTDANDVLGVSDIAVSTNYTTDNTLYIATGDRDGGSMWTLGGGQSNDNNSIGVLKTTDAGATWNTTGLTFTVSQKRSVNRLLIDPSNNDILYAATSVGLFKTTDAGVNWTQLTATHYIDIKFKPGTSSTIYASNWSGDIDRSTDSGANFTNVLSTSNNRVELAVSPNNSSIVYALMDGTDGLGGVYKSTNSGASFSSVYSGPLNLLGWGCDGGDPGDQGSYDLCIATDPTNANIVFVGGVNNWKSTDAGVNWSINTHWSSNCEGNATTVHADKHFLAFQNGTATLFQCNDGGVYKTTDEGNNWTDKSNGIVHSQLYRIGVSQTEPDATITGLQDNGTKLRQSNSTWSDVKGGDGMECLIDYTNYNVQYGTYVQGQISRTTDAWVSSIAIEPAGGYPGFWVTPYVIDPNANQTLYAGYADVWKTTDRGDNWNKISTMNSGQELRSVAVAPSNSNYIYTADPNQLWVTTDGGSNWTERTTGLPVSTNAITYIAVKHDDPSTVWVSFGGYDGDRVYQSIDAGQNWTNISTGLPSLPIMSIVENKQNTTDTELYVGTDVGVYINIGVSNWQEYNTGLPNVVVSELEIYYDDTTPENSRLRAATFGRGLWQTDLYTAPSGPMTYVSSTTTQDNTSVTYRGNIDQEIIGVEIVTSGNESPLDVTSFTFNTNGSTNADGDIDQARLYFTGTSSVFATSNQFGASTTNPNGVFTLTGTQSLSSGTNHFWLVYDIDAAAIISNLVDAECTSLTVDSSEKTPDVTAPAGNREIASCVLCYSWGNTQWDTSTTRVLFNTIDNTSAKPTDVNGNAYSDYTNQTTNIAKNQSYDLTVQVNTDGDYAVDTKAWIDWNQDCDFDDAGEEYDLGTATNVADGATSNSALSINVPADAVLGNTIMRVSTKFDTYATSCETDFDGEVEDYTLNITNCNSSNQTTWNGTTWSNGSPDVTKPVVIAGDYNGTTNFTCCELTINNGATLTINANEYIQIEHDFVNNGTIDILHEGSLVQTDDDANVSGSGTYEIHKTTPNYLDYDYTYWSSPLDNETIGNVFVANPASYIFSLNTANFLDLYSGSHPQTTGVSDSFDDNNDDWELANTATVMQKGKGYIAMGAGSAFPLVLPPTDTQTQSVVFSTGKVNNGVITIPVSLDKYNQDNADTDPNPYSGADSEHTNANLIGNPYPSAIDISLLRTDLANASVLEGSFYFWTHDTAIATGGGPWAWNFTNDDYSTVGVDTNGVVSITGAGNGGGTAANRYIASCQGFLANVTGNGQVTFNNSMRVTGENTHFLNVEEEIMVDRFWLNLTDEDVSVFRQLLIGFYDTATDAYQAGQDVQRLENGNNVDFYSRIENDERHFAIQNLATFSDSKVVSLGMEIMEAGDYIISVNQVEGLFSFQNIYLFDRQLNILHNLTQKSFRFSVSDTDLFDPIYRFEISFIENTTASNQKEILQMLSIYPNPSKGVFTIAIQSTDAIDIKVFDLSGKQLINKQNTDERQIDLTNFAKGFYFVKISMDGQEIVKKLILK